MIPVELSNVRYNSIFSVQWLFLKLGSTGKVASPFACSEESLTKAEVDFFNWACVPSECLSGRVSESVSG